MTITNRELRIMALLLAAIVAAGVYQHKATTPQSSPAQAPGQSISADQLGDAWPLSVPSGKIYCERGARYVFEQPNGTKWGINGAAIGPYPALRPLLLDNTNPDLACRPDEPNCVTPKMSLTPFFDIAKSLC
ncbi:hypothetical protein HA052_15040 [Chromobacterium haemolyticum]|uniref:DUF2511 domain-containing protein n=1 Tax=Chromobacterium fluminis TaxID=3044269 RepID=A0ABX0LAT9_9NEIS|nr:hypothetical protein [Chromobacterium haemolyticum]NHR06506.1 hypothetical protein [Chromobacterium haemolyticum]